MSRLRALFLANLGLQGLDGWVTFVAVGRGLPEGNPLVAAAMASVGPAWGIAAIKLLAAGLLYLVYRRREHPYVEPGLISVAVAYTLVAVVPWMVILSATPR